jgi:hypothetical protein
VVHTGAEREINVPDGAMKRVAEVLAAAKEETSTRSGRVSATTFAALFDECSAEIFTLVRRDSLPRFVVSDGFKALRDALGAHAEEHCCADAAAFDAALAAAVCLPIRLTHTQCTHSTSDMRHPVHALQPRHRARSSH